MDDPVDDVVRRLCSLTAEEYRQLEQRTHELDPRALAFDDDACRALVATLGTEPVARDVGRIATFQKVI